MQWTKGLAHKIYFVVFAWFCLGELAGLFTAESDTFLYYNILGTLHSGGSTAYHFAILRAVTNTLCLAPLFCVAFNKQINALNWLFKPLLIVRVVADIIGHNYEWLFMKSMAHEAGLAGFIPLGIYIAFILPSYQAHLHCISPRKTT